MATPAIQGLRHRAVPVDAAQDPVCDVAARPCPAAGLQTDRHTCARASIADLHGTSCVSPANLAIAHGSSKMVSPTVITNIFSPAAPDSPPDSPIRASITMGSDALSLPPGPYQLTSKHTLTTPMRRARCIASIRCSSSSIARPPRIDRGEWVGLPIRSVPLGGANCRRRFRTARLGRPALQAKALPRWASSTSSKAMRLI